MEPTVKQKKYAEALAKKYNRPLPEEYTKRSYAVFISDIVKDVVSDSTSSSTGATSTKIEDTTGTSGATPFSDPAPPIQSPPTRGESKPSPLVDIIKAKLQNYDKVIRENEAQRCILRDIYIVSKNNTTTISDAIMKGIREHRERYPFDIEEEV